MKELIEKEILKSFFTPPNPGDVVKGKIIGKQKSALFLDLGALGTGVVLDKEFSLVKQVLKDIEVGQEITAKVVGLDNEDGYIELSIAKAQKEVAWQTLKERKENQISFPVIVTKANKGGLMATVEGVVGFLPVSQLKQKHYPKVEGGDQAKILQKLQKFIGKELKVVVLNLDSKQETLILSEKEADLEKTKETLKNFSVNDVVEGIITGVVDFGAFIKFPSHNDSHSEADEPSPEQETTRGSQIEGLIHISELDWQLIQNPSDVVQVGEKVKAKIIDITNGRVSLSLKALKKDPWENIEEKYQKGDTVKGTVSKFNPFGAFVQIKPKIQGLIHISEFKGEEEMKKALEVGKDYQFRIAVIEPGEHRMILNLVTNETRE